MTDVTLRERGWQLLPLTAVSAAELDRTCDQLADFLERQEKLSLAQLAKSLQMRKPVGTHRRVLLCEDRQDALACLRTRPEKRVKQHELTGPRPQLVFLFSGQGAQYPNMGRDLYATEPVFREAVEACFDRLRGQLPGLAHELLFPDQVGPEAEALLQRTEITQPLVFVLEYALTRLLASWGLRPDAVLGYSFGEIMAAFSAGVLDLDTALRLVVERGRLMATLPPGAMLSVPLGADEVQPLLASNPELSLAVDNDGSCILSGPSDAVASLKQDLRRRGLLSMPIPVAHAAHSTQMLDLTASFQAVTAQLNYRPPSLPYVSSVTADWIRPDQACDPGYWADHLAAPVRFAAGLKRMTELGDAVYLEIGPGRDLAMLAHRLVGEKVVLHTTRPKTIEADDSHFLQDRLARLWTLGFEVEWGRG